MKSRTVSATQFKAQCLSLLDDVAQHRQKITVTKRGKPVAQLGPLDRKPWKSTRGALAGELKIIGDLDNFSMANLWNVVREVEQKKNGKR